MASDQDCSKFSKHKPTASSFNKFSDRYDRFLKNLEADKGISPNQLDEVFRDFRQIFYLSSYGEYAWPSDPTNIFDTVEVVVKKIARKFKQNDGSLPTLRITSGFRPKLYNCKHAGGKPTSKHVSFEAMDVSPIRSEKFELFKRVCDVVYQEEESGSKAMGFGIYDHRNRNSTFCHLDKSSSDRPETWIQEPDGGLNFQRPDGVVNLPINDPTPAPRDSEGDENPDEPEERVIFDDQPEEEPFDEIRLQEESLEDYITPEEYRKGIIARFFPLNEWYMNHVTRLENEDQKQADQSEQEKEQNDSTSQQQSDSGETEDPESRTAMSGNNESIRGDISASERQLYLRSVVTAEFWRRRYRSRTVQAASGPFNPNPVSGFPGLIMTPERPVIGMIQSVSHQIAVQGGQARTSISMRSPRYWDEGDPWYYFGGWSEEDHKGVTGEEHDKYQKYYRRFPYWHNRYAIPENNIDPNGEPRQTHLDVMYQHLIGCDAIEYESIHSRTILEDGEMNYGKMERALKDREFTDDMAINEETLALKDYNRLIAETNKNGKFKEGTLAHRLWGNVRPYDVTERGTTDRDLAEDYIERKSVSEVKLMRDFLGNEPRAYEGRLVYIGNTFDNEENQLNELQGKVVEYIEDLEKRELGQGVLQEGETG